VARSARVLVAVAVWRLSRPALWMVSLLPFAVGYALATKSLVPSPTRLVLFFAMGALVMGPLVWLATLAINDVHDVPSDRANPRKAGSPLVAGTLTVRAARRVAYGSGALALTAATFVNVSFAVLTACFLALAWAYSVPPVRLKARPGADVAVNAVGIGVLPLLAGWSVARPLGAFPWWFLLVSVGVAVALYMPTTLVDFDADVAAGDHTIATRLGRRNTYLVGWWAWVTSGVATLALSATDEVVPRSLFAVYAGFVPVLLVEYHALIGTPRTSPALARGIVILSMTFLVPSAAFALVYTGACQ
jgi:lycopene elongase/hydratase (dihydrobisanhydrobacterioruberin-forming)